MHIWGWERLICREPPIWTIVEHVLQSAVMLSSSEMVQNVRSGDNAFCSLVYTAWLYAVLDNNGKCLTTFLNPRWCLHVPFFFRPPLTNSPKPQRSSVWRDFKLAIMEMLEPLNIWRHCLLIVFLRSRPSLADVQSDSNDVLFHRHTGIPVWQIKEMTGLSWELQQCFPERLHRCRYKWSKPSLILLLPN